MNRLAPLVLLPLLVIPTLASDDGPLSIRIEPPAERFRHRPDGRMTRVEIRIVLENRGEVPIRVVRPNAFKIFPNPYLVRTGERVETFWSGDPMCAPSFREEDRVDLDPGEKLEGRLDWHRFVEGFPDAPGRYRLAVRYRYRAEGSGSLGASIEGLTELESAWSNEIEVVIED